MDSEVTFTLILNACGAGWFTLATYQWPPAWRAARAGKLAAAARLAAITLKCLLVITMLTWPTGFAHTTPSAAGILGPSSVAAVAIRLGVLAALMLLLAVLTLTLAVGIRTRSTNGQLTA